MKTLQRIKLLLEYLGGLGDEAPVRVPAWLGPWLWGAWWAFLTMIIVFFCGQSSKFIYIDF